MIPDWRRTAGIKVLPIVVKLLVDVVSKNGNLLLRCSSSG